MKSELMASLVPATGEKSYQYGSGSIEKARDRTFLIVHSRQGSKCSISHTHHIGITHSHILLGIGEVATIAIQNWFCVAKIAMNFFP